ncbi:ESPR domain-containing protein, partial [Thorsellia kenyensis]
MNKIYKVIWNYALNCYTVCGELSKRAKKFSFVSLVTSPKNISSSYRKYLLISIPLLFPIYAFSNDLVVSITPPPTNTIPSVGLLDPLLGPVNNIITTLNKTNKTVIDLTAATKSIVDAINLTNQNIVSIETDIDNINAALSVPELSLGENAVVDASASNALAIGTNASVGENANSALALGVNATIAESAVSSIGIGSGALIEAATSVGLGDNASIGTGSIDSLALGSSAAIGTGS